MSSVLVYEAFPIHKQFSRDQMQWQSNSTDGYYNVFDQKHDNQSIKSQTHKNK